MKTEVLTHPGQINPAAWNALLARQRTPTPFMRHEYLAALHDSGSAVPATGWTPRFVLLWRGGELAAACPLYLKSHSWGEYVFDFAWARAYAEHGLAYYPKALVAVPFTPVPGSRLLAMDGAARAALVQALLALCRAEGWPSLHLLFGDADDIAACRAAGLMTRQTVQFHWQNTAGWPDFDAFLASLSQDKRKKIRQARRKVLHDAGVRFRWARGGAIAPQDWAFFYRCYQRTYLEHGNAPYLTPAFFAHMAQALPQPWVLFIAEQAGQPVACSLIAVDDNATHAGREPVAWGRYWGALARVDSLHFEACYHQPIEWCLAHGVTRFEGGAQGEHKMARALLPVTTHSAHWLAHPAFASAVQDFLAREDAGMAHYMNHLRQRTPFKADAHLPEPGDNMQGHAGPAAISSPPKDGFHTR